MLPVPLRAASTAFLEDFLAGVGPASLSSVVLPLLSDWSDMTVSPVWVGVVDGVAGLAEMVDIVWGRFIVRLWDGVRVSHLFLL